MPAPRYEVPTDPATAVGRTSLRTLAPREGRTAPERRPGPPERADEKEATVWIDGLDKINKVRGINLCVDLSATPYYLGRMGSATNTVFPWVVSDFGLTDAIEAGMVKVPQLVARGPTGQKLESYFNIWAWILPKLTAGERGSKRGSPKAEAILKHAHTPIAILGGMWAELLADWRKQADPRPPVFILVAKNKKIAKALYEWIGEDVRPPGIPSLNIPECGTPMATKSDPRRYRCRAGDRQREREIRQFGMDALHAGHSGAADLARGQTRQADLPGRIRGVGDEAEPQAAPTGRDVRCIVSVGMLTEGWDCQTVTHVIGLRPFQSQLLCEQVVGRALRRRSYEVQDNGKFQEEVAKVFGVPFEVVPFKATGASAKPQPPQRRIYAVPERKHLAITVPRVLGYSIGVRNKVMVADWDALAGITLDPMRVPPETQVAAALNMNRPSILAPGGVHDASLSAFRAKHRDQELAFQMARDLTRAYVQQATCEAPPHVLFPQVLGIVRRYIEEKVRPLPPAERMTRF